jgi:hypothetical protein
VGCLLLALGAWASQPALANVLVVANCNDTGSGSLRNTVASAHSGDTIDLRALSCDKILLSGGAVDVVVGDLVLQGPGAGKLTIYGSQQGHFSAIRHAGAGVLDIESLRVAGSTSNNPIFTTPEACIESNGTLSLNESVVTGCDTGGTRSVGLTMQNSAVSHNQMFGVMAADGDVSITGSTISDNFGTDACLGVNINTQAYRSIPLTDGRVVRIENTTISGNHASRSYYSGYLTGAAGCINRPATITNSTVAFNSSDGGGVSGLVITSASVVLESSIFANNSRTDLAVPASAVIRGHNNLLMSGATVYGAGAKAVLPTDTLTTDPLLQPLADNGGPTMTHALGAGSPAIDAGNNNSSLRNDQRGVAYARVFGARADIGAFEAQPAASIVIGPGFTGTWYDPTQSGHGIFVEVLDGNLFSAYWFAFTPDGTQQSWFGGVGNYSGATATIAHVNQPGGGRWIPNFNPANVVLQPWGSFTFTFSDCNHGRVDFNSGLGYGAGHMDLTRLTKPAGLYCP